jgi:hypothetical protein
LSILSRVINTTQVDLVDVAAAKNADLYQLALAVQRGQANLTLLTASSYHEQIIMPVARAVDLLNTTVFQRMLNDTRAFVGSRPVNWTCMLALQRLTESGWSPATTFASMQQEHFNRASACPAGFNFGTSATDCSPLAEVMLHVVWILLWMVFGGILYSALLWLAQRRQWPKLRAWVRDRQLRQWALFCAVAEINSSDVHAFNAVSTDDLDLDLDLHEEKKGDEDEEIRLGAQTELTTLVPRTKKHPWDTTAPRQPSGKNGKMHVVTPSGFRREIPTRK